MFRKRLLNLRKGSTNAPSTSQAISTSVYQPKETQQQQQEKENEDNIISSQDSSSTSTSTVNKTQNAIRSRFLSQRQVLLNASQSQVNKGKNPFEIILFNCGLEITDLGCELQRDDPISFTRLLKVLLSSKDAQTKRQYIDIINRDFQLTNEEKFVKCEKFMRGIFMSDGQVQHQTQTSLIMCLLAIESFKEDIVKILLERLKEYVKEKADPDVIGLVLTQFKFSDQILNNELYNFMFEELFVIFKSLKSFECQEVIVQQFKELEISKQEEAGCRLVSIFERDKQKLLQFLDIFCLMALDDKTINDIFEVIQGFIEKDCTSNQYLPMIKYSIHYAHSPDDVVDILRNQVKWEICTKSTIGDIFKIIGKSLIRDGSKTIEAWTKAISDVNSKDDLKYIDIIMLLLVADTNTETHLNAVRKIVLDKITKGIISSTYLRNSFKIFAVIIPKISQTLLELLDSLQKAKDSQTYEFLATCYKLLFRYSGEAKIIIGSLTNFLCEKKSYLPFSSTSDFKMTILNILHDVLIDNSKSASELLINHKILLRALDISRVELTLNEHRSLMKLLSTLVYGIDYSSGLKSTELRAIQEVKETLSEHLNMVNSKYINNPEVKIRQLGIIGAVKIISALVFDKVDPSEITPDFVIAPEQMQRGPVLDAIKLIQLIEAAADKNFEMLAMFYDEMAMELKPSSANPQMSQIFINYYGESIFNQLNDLIVTEVEINDDEVKFVNKFENLDETFETPDIVLPLGTMIYADNKENLILPSLFKLALLLTYYRYNSNESLLACCACAIAVPEHFATAEDKLCEDQNKAKIQLDIYFHCCNWLRELISGFIRSDELSIIKLVKSRLKQLIQIEKHLNRLLQNTPSGYCPQLLNESQKKSFESLTKEKVVTRAPKVRKKNEAEVVKKGFKIRSSEYCREMDNELVLLLKEKFLFNAVQTDDEQLTLTELNYILVEIHRKLEMIFKPKKVEQKKIIDEVQAIKDFQTAVIPHLTRIFNEINEQIKNSMDVDDQNSMKVAKQATKTFFMILEIFNLIFNSKKLHLEEKLMTSMLKTLLVNYDKSRLQTQESICGEIIEKYSKFADNVSDLKCAVALIDFIMIINSFSGKKNNYNTQIHDMAEHFLHENYECDNNSNLEKLLSIYVNKATDINQVDALCSEVEKFCKNTQENHFPMISKSNFICMIRVYLKRTSEIINNTKNVNFEFWEKATSIQFKFVEAVKWQKSAMALNLFLKNFIVFLKRFNSDGIVVLRSLVKDNVNDFIDLMKNIQRIRRSAHGAACELKHRKNQSISKILPSVRQQFEAFHQEVCIIIRNGNIPMSAVFSGPLKNFDIRQEDIFSQNTTVASSNGSGNELSSDNDDDDDSNVANKDSSDSDEEGISFVHKTRSRSTIL